MRPGQRDSERRSWAQASRSPARARERAVLATIDYAFTTEDRSRLAPQPSSSAKRARPRGPLAGLRGSVQLHPRRASSGDPGVAARFCRQPGTLRFAISALRSSASCLRRRRSRHRTAALLLERRREVLRSGAASLSPSCRNRPDPDCRPDRLPVRGRDSSRNAGESASRARSMNGATRSRASWSREAFRLRLLRERFVQAERVRHVVHEIL